VTEERWKQLTYWPLIAVSIAFIVAYSWQVIADLEGPQRRVTQTIIFVTWVVFLGDYVVRLMLASPRGRWFRRHIFDLLVVILPALKPLRLLRVFTIFHVLQRTAGSALRSRIAIYGAGTAILLIWICSLAVLDAERGAPGANIEDFGDAIWWAFVTLTTVGYGDFYPVTWWGRTVAVGLMVCGVAVVGVVTATLASWVIERASQGHDDDEPSTRKQVRALSDQLTELNAKLGSGNGA
jgi:voltage-gated potassium channel